jgi:hypothetical protein
MNATPTDESFFQAYHDVSKWGTMTYQIFRVMSSITHFTVAIIILSTWTKIGSPKLYSSAYFTTDMVSMLYGISNNGMVPSSSAMPFLPILGHSQTTPITLNTESMLGYAQPVILKYEGDNAYTFAPNKCTEILAISIDNTGIDPAAPAPRPEDVAAWKACRAADVPTRLVDMAYDKNTMTFFGSNNMLALLYNTMVITAAIAIACLPTFGSSMMDMVWFMMAEALLLANFLTMLAFPFTQGQLHLPPNNCILVGLLHAITGIGILIFYMKNRTDTGIGKLNRRASPQSENNRYISLLGADDNKEPNTRLLSGWVDDFTATMHMVNVRYFEYSMTAGLFLVSLTLMLYPNGDAYVYQQVYTGMLFCNLVAIPITNAIIGFAKAKDGGSSLSTTEDQGWIIAGIILVLCASLTFFAASFAPFFLNAGAILNNPEMPQPVKGVVGGTIAVFFLFAGFGTFTILYMLREISMSKKDNKNTSVTVLEWTMNQLIGYEVLNWGKWIIAAVILGSARFQIGLE